MEAQELLARLALEDNNTAKAHRGSRQGADDVAGSAGGHGHSGHHRLAGRQEANARGSAGFSRSIRTTARPTPLAGHFFVLNRRYDEGISYYRKAIELDAGPAERALANSGINLMRLGQEKEAREQLEVASTTVPEGRSDHQLAAR